MSFERLWNEDTELSFFKNCENFATPEQLFYKTSEDKYLAYWPKNYNGTKYTLQSRNSLIGNFTEKWFTDLCNYILKDDNLYAIQGGQCSSIGLTSKSPGDVVIADTNNKILSSENIKLVFEVKMSLLWNWELNKENNHILKIGDYKSHNGTPSLLRSDSMLKAIGKCINIRVSNFQSSKIPLIVIGNTPISKTYYSKVDNLKKSGIIQGFWSVNPKPLDSEETIKSTENKGFLRMDDLKEFEDNLYSILSSDLNFFSSMKSSSDLGHLIEIANNEESYEDKGQCFLNLLREE